MSVAPVIVRNFAAVDVATEYETFHLNRQRLEDAIRFLSEIPHFGDPLPVSRMREKYPYIGTHQMTQYMLAAQACIDHNVTP